jgi:hypothetical protein
LIDSQATSQQYNASAPQRSIMKKHNRNGRAIPRTYITLESRIVKLADEGNNYSQHPPLTVSMKKNNSSNEKLTKPRSPNEKLFNPNQMPN